MPQTYLCSVQSKLHGSRTAHLPQMLASVDYMYLPQLTTSRDTLAVRRGFWRNVAHGLLYAVVIWSFEVPVALLGSKCKFLYLFMWDNGHSEPRPYIATINSTGEEYPTRVQHTKPSKEDIYVSFPNFPNSVDEERNAEPFSPCQLQHTYTVVGRKRVGAYFVAPDSGYENEGA